MTVCPLNRSSFNLIAPSIVLGHEGPVVVFAYQGHGLRRDHLNRAGLPKTALLIDPQATPNAAINSPLGKTAAGPAQTHHDH